MNNIEKIQDEVIYWISLEKKGINLQKNSSFISWVNKSEKNKIAFDEQKCFINEVNNLPDKFLDQLTKEVKEERKRIKRRKKFIISFISLSAACFILVLYPSFFINNNSYSKNYVSSNKVRDKISLPDKSVVALDVDTTMKIKYYEDKREVFLSKGKAVFDVTSNKNRPFLVKTNDIIIKVLGTKFEVINTKNFELNVKEGEVAVFNKNNKLIALVSKNQSLILDKYFKINSLKEKDLEEMALWSEGKFSFEQEPLKDVISEFLKYENFDIQIENKDLEKLPISGNFTSKEFDKIINVLPLIHPVNIIKTKEKIFIKEKI